MTDTFLNGLLVVEIGNRPAVGACASLLAELGADVVLVEPKAASSDKRTKWTHRAMVAAGKRSIAVNPAHEPDITLLRRAIAQADVVITSGDLAPLWAPELLAAAAASTVICDITAFGSTGPLAGHPYPDALVQALAGVVDTTGDDALPPVVTRIPVTEWAAAVYALSGVLAALRVRDLQGAVQRVEIALFDCAISCLTTFLPACFVGEQPQRVGNHHPSMSPWNAYRASDGWVMLCAGSDEMWRRVCEVIDRSDLAADEQYATPTHRMKLNAGIDDIVQTWTLKHPVAHCVDRFAAAGLPCGPIHTISELFSEASLVHRRMIRQASDPVSGNVLRISGPLFRGSAVCGRAAEAIAAPDADRAWLATRIAAERPQQPARARGAAVRPVLDGIRVVEIGSYTTAPLCARQLAALGADVIKVEPPIGDPARVLPPIRNGQGYFFTMNNSDKRALTLDLRTAEGKRALRALLAAADVFVDNLKPDSLPRLGFGREALAVINPRLIHCSVSGFGADSPLANRPGMDTTIQGMAGIMDLTRFGETPYKTGISVADLTGAQLSLAAVLASLAYRERTGTGMAIDLAMHDAGAWLTRGAWNDTHGTDASNTLVQCSDGYVVADSTPEIVARCAALRVPDAPQTSPMRAAMLRSELVSCLSLNEVAAAPVLRVNEVIEHPQVKMRELLVRGIGEDGIEWPLLASPVRLALTPARVKRPITSRSGDVASVLDGWSVRNDAHAAA